MSEKTVITFNLWIERFGLILLFSHVLERTALVTSVNAHTTGTVESV